MACLFASSSPRQHICKVLSPEAPESGDYRRQKGEIYEDEKPDMELTEYEGKCIVSDFCSVSPTGSS